MTTGITDEGEYDCSGHYGEQTVGSSWSNNDTEISLYAYANSAYVTAERMKEEATIYVLGIFSDDG